ncbi:MAG: YkgJ family cysteine cluster protein [Candidatus Omnitrophica bacterium]|nr:YkgJ family cysteine cluster protein [Candidatus Omnitrophota bacterium]
MMFTDLKQFLSSQMCLSCDGCCRFDSLNNDWRPKVGAIEADHLIQNKKLKAPASRAGIIDGGGYLPDKACHGLFMCEFFNLEDTTCAIYHHRPFECRLYPFVLTKRLDKNAVSVHLTCPYIMKMKGSSEYDRYVSYLKDYFTRNDLLVFLQENPHLFGEYPGYESELEEVFPVCF